MDSNKSAKFSRDQHTHNRLALLTTFQQRRALYNHYLQTNRIAGYTCPGCGYPTLTQRASFEICQLCSWEDDGQDDPQADAVWGGPNSNLSLTENRLQTGEALLAASANQYTIEKENPASVIALLYTHHAAIREILNRIPKDATTDHPFFEEYRLQRQQLLQQIANQ